MLPHQKLRRSSFASRPLSDALPQSRSAVHRLSQALERRPTHSTDVRQKLVPVKDLATIAPTPPSVAIPAVQPRVRQLQRVQRLRKPRRFPVASLDLSRKDIGVPYGAPKLVNAATVKVLAGGRSFDRLLKRTASGWEFMPDHAVVDLSDASQEYRLGRLTIFS